MRLCLFAVLVVVGALACGGLANDVTKGANTTEREVNKETGHDRTVRDGGVAADAGDSGAISM